MVATSSQAERVLLLDGFGGLAGDMLLGALLDLGVERDSLVASLDSLGLEGWSLEVEAVNRRQLGCTKATFVVSAPAGGHSHRHLPEILRMIAESRLSARAKDMAERSFRALARAEAKVHRIDETQVHFHEVGADDAILDICGVCVGLDQLAIRTILSGPLPGGTGTVRCDHGELPCPVPAVVELLAGSFDLIPGEGTGEMVTPTGAALLRAWGRRLEKGQRVRPLRAGYGAGTRAASVLRLTLCEESDLDATGNDDVETDEIIVLETHIDDGTAEQLAFLMERCMQAGALDVSSSSVLMKKGRLGHCLKVMVEPRLHESIVALIFAHSSTLGIREQRVRRRLLARKSIVVETEWGAVRVKISGGRARPEYEDCARIAREHGVALAHVERTVAELGSRVNA